MFRTPRLQDQTDDPALGRLSRLDNDHPARQWCECGAFNALKPKANPFFVRRLIKIAQTSFRQKFSLRRLLRAEFATTENQRLAGSGCCNSRLPDMTDIV
jgi:hypothetical protein